MSCPTCGATTYHLVTPGVAECQGAVTVPTGAHPSGAQGPTGHSYICGTRYQIANTAGTVPLCDCGMQSVGSCTTCGKPLCLDHTYRSSGKVICRADAEAIAMEVTAAKAALRARVRQLIERFAASRLLTPEYHEHGLRKGTRPASVEKYAPSDGLGYTIRPDNLQAAREGGPCPDGKAGWQVDTVEWSRPKLFDRTTRVTYARCLIGTGSLEFQCQGKRFGVSINSLGDVNHWAALRHVGRGQPSWWDFVDNGGSVPTWLSQQGATPDQYFEALADKLTEVLGD